MQAAHNKASYTAVQSYVDLALPCPGLSYERSPGDTNNSESGDSHSIPASVTSLSE